jgi:hypothetical protein
LLQLGGGVENRAAQLSPQVDRRGFRNNASRLNERQGRGKETGERGGEIGGERATVGMQRAGRRPF